MENSLLKRIRELVDGKIAAYRANRESRELQEKSLCLCLESVAEIPCGLVAGHVEECKKLSSPRKRLGRTLNRVLPPDLPVPPVTPRPPDLQAANLSFAARVVIAVRDRFGGDAPKVYTAAKLTRQVYSQIVSDETRKVSKRTAVRFAFALHLTKDEAVALLKSAGYAFSNSLTEDFILQACLEVEPPLWNLDDVNLLLREYRVDFQF